jgi:DNA-binding LacI/PurR family transcriptional regulator
MSAPERPSSPRILYLSVVPGNLGHELKLAGIRRYCSARGWEAEAIGRPEFSSAKLPAMLRERSPIGCVVEGIGNRDVPPPRIFGSVPVAYLECPPEIAGNAPNILVDDAAIAREAVRELSAGRPDCYAAVGSMNAARWSRLRLRAFREAVAAETGKRCAVFPTLSQYDQISYGDYLARLVKWIAALPRNCAVFAASDVIAERFAKAAKAALRNIPKELTLLSTDNHPEICEAADPSISSIQLDLERMGFLAAKALGEKITGATVVGPLLTVRRRSTSGRGRREPWVMDAVAAIRAEACDGLSASGLISRYPVSKRLFTMRFREATGHSVLDEIMHVRLEKAYTLLSQTDTAIGAIPSLCGFRSERTLEALFLDRTGMSMRDWRKRNSR